jgi:hypothetical protein
VRSRILQRPWISSVFDAQLPLRHLSAPAPWAGHIPFAFWAVAHLQPRRMVELGSYSGISYFAFCQAIKHAELGTRIHAIDTWAGDSQAGFYGEEIFQRFVDCHRPYEAFSTFHRKTFDCAVTEFADHSIDLLHIDGLHTYEAVSHDFRTWLPKLTSDAIVLFHDVREYSGDFGVHRFWEELMDSYTGFTFDHSHGLGVLCLSESSVKRFLVHQIDPTDADCLQDFCDLLCHLGEPHELRAALSQSTAMQHNYERQLLHHQQVVQALHDVERLRDELILENQRVGKWSMLPWVRWLKGVCSGAARTLWRTRRLWRLSNYISARAINAIRYLIRGDLPGLIMRMNQVRRDGFTHAPLNIQTIGLLSVPHALSVARSFSQALQSMGFDILEPITSYRDQPVQLWFVFGAQALKRLPPSGRRLIVQLEQTTSSRWFTRRYRRVLLNSVGVLDFSQRNLEGLAYFGVAYPHSYLVRLAGFSVSGHLRLQRDIDVLFYGDPYCERRQRALAVLRKQVNVTVVTDVFGDAVQALIGRARVVVNIHYYPEANLETTRLYECLSLGARVVSEVSPDVDDYPELRQVVRFVPNGDFDALTSAVGEVLAMASDASPDYGELVSRSQTQLRFDLARLLQGIGVRDQRLQAELQYDVLDRPMVLSLPETPSRHKRALTYFPTHFQRIIGMRATPGWLGCGLSYQYLAQAALNRSREKLWVFEDDAVLPENPDAMLSSIDRFLESYSDWDVFCGLLTRFESTPVIVDLVEFEDHTFVVLDQMMSMVANCYGSAALSALANWMPDVSDPLKTTIDVYLNRQINRVVTIYPAIFGHAVDQNSTLWGIENKHYEPMLADASRQLEKAIEAYRESGSP